MSSHSSVQRSEFTKNRTTFPPHAVSDEVRLTVEYLHTYIAKKMRIKKGKEKKTLPEDPVKNFEKWRKKHDKSRKKTKRPRKKREWEIEREIIQKLVAKYAEVSQHLLYY